VEQRVYKEVPSWCWNTWTRGKVVWKRYISIRLEQSQHSGYRTKITRRPIICHTQSDFMKPSIQITHNIFSASPCPQKLKYKMFSLVYSVRVGKYEGVSKNFRTESITKYMLTTILAEKQ